MKKKNLELRNRAEYLIESEFQTALSGINAETGGVVLTDFAQTHSVKTAKRSAKPIFAIGSPLDDVKAQTVVDKIEADPFVSDDGIRYLIAQAFRRNVRARTDRVIVSVDKGVVKLWGSVPTWDERREAERAISLLPGVGAVENNLKIEP